MKCPKCQYLSYDTGERCKNCGYEFALVELQLPSEGAAESEGPSRSSTVAWDQFDSSLASEDDDLGEMPLREPAVEPASTTPVPLFALSAEDQPLVRVPPTPRRPLAVRRTPDHPHLRAAPLAVGEADTLREAALDYPQETELTSEALSEKAPPVGSVAAPPGRTPLAARRVHAEPGRRILAALIDYALLAAIDAIVVYFTTRMAGLTLGEVRLLPVVPLLLFLLLIALAYVSVFTAIGGQTIGKMVARIKVVPDRPGPLGTGHAFERTMAIVVCWLTGGLGFLLVLVGDHRALHDRLSRTHVVDVA